MSGESAFSELLGRSFASGSSFLSSQQYGKDADAEGGRLMRMDSGAIRVGVLEKATKDAASWKQRRCALHAEAFWYLKDVPYEPEGTKDSRTARSQWTCIPLSTCVQLLRWPEDGRVFLVQTGSRSYYWRAKSQGEAEAWLLSIGAQCAAMKEMDMLRQAEDRLIRTEESRTEVCLGFLESFYTLEGTLRYHNTKELLVGFLMDFFCFPPKSNAPKSVEPGQAPHCADAPLFGDAQHSQPASQKGGHREVQPATPGNSGSLFLSSLSSNDTCAAGFTRQQIQDYVNGWASRHPDSTSRAAQGNEEASVSHAEESDSDTDKRIGKWLRTEIFPKFISSSIIQRRLAQLAASRSVVNWGIDPVKSPLLSSNIFDGC